MDRRNFLQAMVAGAAGLQAPDLYAAQKTLGDESIKDYLFRIRNPDLHHDGDVVADDKTRATLASVNSRLLAVRGVVGFGNFNVLSFDEMLECARRYSQVGEFSRSELDLLESIFYEDASRYGFYGEKPLGKITERVDLREVIKIPQTGHFVFAGNALTLYEKVLKQIGGNLTLTSGVRSVVKQMQLFIAKADGADGNLSLASRSLAPPGYSFHGVGDFDVGIRGWGERNFTDDFATTDEFRKLHDLGYIDIRYPKDNLHGVRFEPWHIKVG